MIETVINLLIWLSHIFGNLGWAILAFTLFIRVILFPINRIAIKSSIKMKEIQPELQKLQKKYKKKPAELQKKQMELYQEAGVNPLGGCLPQIFQLGIVIILYRALLSLLGTEDVANGSLQTHFFGLDLRQPDPYFILPVLAASAQFVASWLMMGKHTESKKHPSKKQTGKKQASNSLMGETGQMMQKQMMYVMPIMTGVIATRFPAGISLYWVISTIFSMIQQWLVMEKKHQQKALASVAFWRSK